MCKYAANYSIEFQQFKTAKTSINIEFQHEFTQGFNAKCLKLFRSLVY